MWIGMYLGLTEEMLTFVVAKVEAFFKDIAIFFIVMQDEALGSQVTMTN
jgi:hypothetical protein